MGRDASQLNCYNWYVSARVKFRPELSSGKIRTRGNAFYFG